MLAKMAVPLLVVAVIVSPPDPVMALAVDVS
jgi:hypothetical protein